MTHVTATYFCSAVGYVYMCVLTRVMDSAQVASVYFVEQGDALCADIIHKNKKKEPFLSWWCINGCDMV